MQHADKRGHHADEQATVSSSTPDPDSRNNGASASVTVGTPQRPEHIIVRDPHDEDLYVLRPWLARLLERGFDREQKTAYIEQHVSWPLMCALWRAPLLLYAYLEAENWPADGWQREPASPHAEPVHTRELLLEDPLMSVLDLHELSPEAKRIEAVKRAMRLIRPAAVPALLGAPLKRVEQPW